MPQKTCHFQAKTHTDARTACWPWVLLDVWRRFFRLVIDPIPTTQNAIPTRIPLRVVAFWERSFAQPRHFWRSVVQVLVRPNVVVEKQELAHGLLKSSFVIDVNLLNRALKRAKEAFNAAIHPRRMRCTALVSNALLLHGERKAQGNESAVIVSTQRSGFTKGLNQRLQHLQDRCRTFVREAQAQKLATAVIVHAKDREGFTVNRKQAGTSVCCKPQKIAI